MKTNNIDFSDYFLYKQFLYYKVITPLAMSFLCILGILILSNLYYWPFSFKILALICVCLIPFFGGFIYLHFLRKLEKMDNHYLLKFMLIKKGFTTQHYKNSFMNQLINQSNANSKKIIYEFGNSNQKKISGLIYSLIMFFSIYFAAYYGMYENFIKSIVALTVFLIVAISFSRFLKASKRFVFSVTEKKINFNGQLIVVDSTISKLSVTQELKLAGFHPILNLRIGDQKITLDPSLISGDKMLYILLYLQFYTGKTKLSSF